MRSSHASFVAAVAAVNALAAAQPLDIIYVDDDAPPGGDGASWDSAFHDLHDALRLARDQGFPIEVRVAQGTYRPDSGTLDRDASFTPSSAVTLLGAFAGIGAANPDERDTTRFVSVLSGDLQGDDTPGFGNRADNAYRVVDVTHADAYLHLEGFTIRGGHADGLAHTNAARGAAVGADTGWRTAVALHKCIITDNYATTEGAAVSADGGWVTMADCQVLGNEIGDAGLAAAVYSRNLLHVDRTRFAGNATRNIVAATALGCDGWLQVQDSLFDSNRSGRSVVMCSSEASFLRCTFAGNSTGTWPTILGSGSRVFLGGCILWNDAGSGIEVRAGLVHVEQSCVRGGVNALQSWNEPAIWDASSITADPSFASPAGADSDPATWHDNDFGLTAVSPCIDAGSTYVDPERPSDVRGNTRYVAANGTCRTRADMGAVEFQVEHPKTLPTRVYVKPDAPHDGDGLSWSTAVATIEAALDVPGVREIWLARGTYFPPAWDRPLYISCDLTILGGFDGSESSADQRDPVVNPTILSGDLLGNDNDAPESLRDNAPNLLVINLASVTLDGVTVRDTAGSPARSGSAVTTSHASLTARNCTFERCRNIGGNQAQGGAIRAWYTDLVLEDCVFRENSAVAESDAAFGGAVLLTSGTLLARDTRFEHNSVVGVMHASAGAVYSDSSRTELIRCAFVENSVASTTNVGASAGALQVYQGDTEVLHCEFRANRCIAPGGWASAGAGSITVWDDGVAAIAGCVFADNSAQGMGASTAALGLYATSLQVVNCSFVNNQAIASREEYSSGAVAVSPPGAVVANSIFWGNTSPLPETLDDQLNVSTGVVVTHCVIQGLYDAFPGHDNSGENPRFISATDLRPAFGSPCIDAGDSSLLPPDTFDLDADADTTEPLPLDIANRPRVVRAHVDIGAYEADACLADYSADGVLNSADFFQFIADYFQGFHSADFNADGNLTSTDVFAYLNAFFAGC